MNLVLVASLVACAPPAAILVLVSQISPLCPAALQVIASVPRAIGYVALAATVVLIVVSWSVNKSRQLPPAVFWTAWWCVLALATVTGVLTLAHHPCFAMAFLTCLGHCLLYPLRHLVFDARDPATWFQAVWIATAISAVMCLAAWIPWIVQGFEGRQKWTDWPQPVRDLVSEHVITWKFAFVAWATPPACATELGVIAVICWVRKQYADTNFHHNNAQLRQGFLVSSMRQLSGWLTALVMVVWIGAAFNATGEIQFNQKREDMRQEVLGLAFLVFLGMALWTLDTFGPEECIAAVTESKVALETAKIMENDWPRGFILLLGAVPMAACIAFDRILSCARAPVPGGSERASAWHFWGEWHWTSVIVKALWLGLAYHALLVGVGKLTTVLLAMVNESLASWPVYSVSAMLFVISFAIFMFPASPGPPIYVVMGIVIVHSALRQGWDFNMALAWATFVAYAMKLSFTAAAQKWIGEPFASSDRVRQLVGIHTPYMRAIEDILVSPKNTAGKVALLVGGPDWPVAVLCGILRLPVLPVLLGISPVLVQSVFPCVLSGALLLAPTGEGQHRSQSLAEVSLVIAGALQLATGVLALFYVQQILEQDYEKLSQKRPGDAALEEIDAKAEAAERAFWRESEWRLLPGYLKASLVCGLLSMEASLVLLSSPFPCFKSFSLMSSVENDLGGNVLSIVKPLGWLAIGLATISALSLTSFYVWVHRAIQGPTQDMLEQEGQKICGSKSA